MKNTITLIALFITSFLFSQSGINYKAVIKDGMGDLVVSSSVDLEFKIIQTSPTGFTNYAETHTTTTDTNGIVIVNIGEGTPIKGTFPDIDWGSDLHFLNVQVDTGSGMTDMGTTQFMAVPYAMDAANVVWKKTGSNDIYNYNSGNVGVGLNLPAQKLDVQGKLKVADDSNPPQVGTIRYNFFSNVFEGHNGTGWDRMTKEDEVKPYFKAILNENTTIYHGFNVPFNQVVYDNMSGFSQPTASTYTIQQSGLYQIGACILSRSDVQVVYLKVNGTLVGGAYAARDPLNTALRYSTIFSTIVNLNEGDEISITVAAAAGGYYELLTHPFASEWNYLYGYKIN